MKRICIWSGPRNVSTALMYSFAERLDTEVVDEPLYGAYLARSDRREEHPNWKKVMASQPTNLGEAVEKGMLRLSNMEVLLMKNMAHHWRGVDVSLLGHFKNILLFRHPALVARSFDQIIEAPSAEDLGYPQQIEILDELTRQELPVYGVDSSEIRNATEPTLKKLCRELDLQFDERMLSWEAGPRPEDGVWAPHWYANVHRSTGFVRESIEVPQVEALPEKLQDVVLECLPYWERLRETLR